MDSRQDGWRTEGLNSRREAGQEGCKTGGLYSKSVYCRTLGMQDRRDARLTNVKLDEF